MGRATAFLFADEDTTEEAAKQAEEAANFYVSVFKNSKVDNLVRNGDAVMVTDLAGAY